MAVFKKTELVIDQTFDAARSRHTVNGVQQVLHCQHYLTLFTQLADDLTMLDGGQLMTDVAEDTFRMILEKYYAEHQIKTIGEKIDIAVQTYAACGLGKMKIVFFGPDSGEVELTESYIDMTWKQKWGIYDKPVNFITRGFIAALFGVINTLPPRSIDVREAESIVSGAKASRFFAVVN